MCIRRQILKTLLDRMTHILHTICMKRTTIVIDEELLEKAARLAGVKTYSKAVETALFEFVRRAEARKILELRGSGLWEGDLAEMRGDTSTSGGH